MQFGLFYEAPEAPGRTHGERLAEMLALIVYGESLGFDVAWLAEIHFGAPFSLLSAPLMLVPAIAARTQRIRIGTAVSLLPLHHPLSLAEHVAMADLLCGGHLEFGVGRGSLPTQFHGFGVPVAENRARFEESLEIMRLAWATERFSYTGKFYRVDNLAVVPKPCQRPHPPLRVGVHTSESFAHLGSLGWPIYSGTTTTPLPQLREGMALYRTALSRATPCCALLRITAAACWGRRQRRARAAAAGRKCRLDFLSAATIGVCIGVSRTWNSWS
jgi:alkanesulfonate monooxygenase SsuD/methylene tetrahydromethanopterin reductase-like flavin-dependent oxidoreductase (luciferase family)